MGFVREKTNLFLQVSYQTWEMCIEQCLSQAAKQSKQEHLMNMRIKKPATELYSFSGERVSEMG